MKYGKGLNLFYTVLIISLSLGACAAGVGEVDEAIQPQGAQPEVVLQPEGSEGVELPEMGEAEPEEEKPVEGVHTCGVGDGEPEGQAEEHHDDDDTQEDTLDAQADGAEEPSNEATEEPVMHQGEPLVLPLNIMVLSSESVSALNSTYQDHELELMMDEVNEIWEQAGLRFELRSILRTPAQNEEAFVELMEQGGRDGRVLRGLYDSRDIPQAGWTMVLIEDMGVMPPGVYFCDQQVLLSGRVFGRQSRVIPPNVVAHELGHALSLEHLCGRGENLMCADGRSPTRLFHEQIEAARAQALTGTAFRCEQR